MNTYSDRHVAVVMAWLELELNRPNRADHYAMQIATEIRQARFDKGKTPRRATLDEMRIPFRRRKKPKTAEEATKIAKRNSIAVLSGLDPSRVVTISKAEAEQNKERMAAEYAAYLAKFKPTKDE